MSVFGEVERMIDLASQALCERRVDLVDEILLADEPVDQMEVEIEEDCLKILALHQPVAADLRRVATILKINSDIERIADLACNIANRAKAVHEYAWFPTPGELPKMARDASLMVRMALDAFVDSDADMARNVIRNDALVDDLLRSIIAEIQDLMKQDTELVEPSLHCFTAARHFERIADHAENIAEDVLYFVEGEIVRHRHDHTGQPIARGEQQP